MELLLTNRQPAKFPGIKNTGELFRKCLYDYDSLNIATGFISSDALIELNKIVEDNNGPHIELMIGMHYFEGFTIAQYQAAEKLHETLSSKALGKVYICNTQPFHGKMYSFSKGDEFVFIMGSSNLFSCLSPYSKNYESDILINDSGTAKAYSNYLIQIITKLSDPFEKVSECPIIKNNFLLKNQSGVKKITIDEMSRLDYILTDIKFNLPLKSTPKSNLNVFFGKGREDKRNRVLPRPWYEVELIVPQIIKSKSNFPYLQEFEVFTDDGWRFKCKTSGDKSKNFRSCGDLLTLGKWIKGRLEESRCLNIGDPVTEDVLDHYGRKDIELIKTKKEGLWKLCFDV